MSEEFSRAISIANNYFALVDGLTSGLEDHLAENVYLDWFGQIVRGKEKVAIFLSERMINSRHMFDEIKPIVKIESPKSHSFRKKSSSEENLATAGNVTAALIKNELNFDKLRIDDSVASFAEESSVVSRKNDESLIFTQNCIAHSLNNENEIQRKRDFSSVTSNQMIQFPIHEENSIKFVEANGNVQFSRLSVPGKIRKYNSSTPSGRQLTHNCRRYCYLQLAYSMQDNRLKELESNFTIKKTFYPDVSSELKSLYCEQKIKTEFSKDMECKKRSRSSEESIESIVDIEPSFDIFGDDLSYFEHRDKFIEYFETEMNKKDIKFNLMTPTYVGDRLVFDWNHKNHRGSEPRSIHSPRFKFNHFIHAIVYKNNLRCKINLSEDFEEREAHSDTEKHV